VPEVPRDPRQLARDILSGKIKIEDLARERQARQGVPVNLRPPAAPASRVPDKIPLPRPAPLPPRVPVPQARPPVRSPMPSRSQQKPSEFPQRPIPQRPAARTVPPPPARQALSPFVVTQTPPAAPARAAQLAPPARPMRLNAMLRSRRAMREGIIFAEIFGKPIALRDETP